MGAKMYYLESISSHGEEPIPPHHEPISPRRRATYIHTYTDARADRRARRESRVHRARVRRPRRRGAPRTSCGVDEHVRHVAVRVCAQRDKRGKACGGAEPRVRARRQSAQAAQLQRRYGGVFSGVAFCHIQAEADVGKDLEEVTRDFPEPRNSFLDGQKHAHVSPNVEKRALSENSIHRICFDRFNVRQRRHQKRFH